MQPNGNGNGIEATCEAQDREIQELLKRNDDSEIHDRVLSLSNCSRCDTSKNYMSDLTEKRYCAYCGVNFK